MCATGAAPDSREATFSDRVGGMDQNLSALERAFQLARSGSVISIGEIRAVLTREGYNGSQIEGPQLKRQLRGLIEAAQAKTIEASRP